MARDVFQMTLSSRYPLIDMPAPTPDVEDVLQALEGIQVSVFKRGTTNPVDAIFQRPTGATQGPTPESGATGGPNPFTTGPSGNVEFWVDGPAEVDVFVHDTVGPARISDRTFGWNATAVGPQSQPTSMLAKDGGITLGSLAAEVKRQMAQIGEVIDWWRPDCLGADRRLAGRSVTAIRLRLASMTSLASQDRLSTFLTCAIASSSEPIRRSRLRKVLFRGIQQRMRLALPELAAAMLLRISVMVTRFRLPLTLTASQRRITTTQLEGCTPGITRTSSISTHRLRSTGKWAVRQAPVLRVNDGHQHNVYGW